jgi:hypothetical protein
MQTDMLPYGKKLEQNFPVAPVYCQLVVRHHILQLVR